LTPKITVLYEPSPNWELNEKEEASKKGICGVNFTPYNANFQVKKVQV
jgi:hypothetical protein